MDTLDSFATGQVNTTSITSQHRLGLGWLGGIGLLVHLRLAVAKKPDADQYQHQKREKFHNIRPKMTSITKREPT